MTRYAKNLEGRGPLDPPGYAYDYSIIAHDQRKGNMGAKSREL